MNRLVLNVLLFATMIAGIVLLTGCAGTPARIVSIPVALPCPAAADEMRPARPVLMLGEVTPLTPAPEVVRAYAGSVEQLQDYSESLETLLDTCK